MGGHDVADGVNITFNEDAAAFTGDTDAAEGEAVERGLGVGIKDGAGGRGGCGDRCGGGESCGDGRRRWLRVGSLRNRLRRRRWRGKYRGNCRGGSDGSGS